MLLPLVWVCEFLFSCAFKVLSSRTNEASTQKGILASTPQSVYHFRRVTLLVFLVAQTVKNLPAMPEAQDRSLGREDPLEKGITTHSRIAWEIPWTDKPGGPQSTGCKGSDMTDRLTLSLDLA